MHLRYVDRLRRQRELAAGGELGRLLRIDRAFARRICLWPRMISACASNWEGVLHSTWVAMRSAVCGMWQVRNLKSCRCVTSACSPQIDRWMRAMLRFPSGVEGVVEFGFRGFYVPRAGVVVTCENGSDQMGRRRSRARKKGQRDSRVVSAQSRPTNSSLRRL